MTAGLVVHYAQDAQSNLAFPTYWWDDGTSNLKQVTVDAVELPSGITPVIGNLTIPGQSASLSPVPSRGFNALLWGTWTGSVNLERSFDQGTTWLVLTTYTTNQNLIEQEPEAGVLYRWNATALSAGTLNYRLST